VLDDRREQSVTVCLHVHHGGYLGDGNFQFSMDHYRSEVRISRSGSIGGDGDGGINGCEYLHLCGYELSSSVFLHQDLRFSKVSAVSMI
jgi:hypothetical protein